MSILYFIFIISVQLFIVDSRNLIEPIPLNVGVHLFADDQYLANISSLEFQNGLIQKDTDHPIVHPEYPWEAGVHFATSLVQVPSNLSVTGKAMYIIYYICTEKDAIIPRHNMSICAANSTDGIKWEKPLLWSYPYTANGTQPPQPSNIVLVISPGRLLGSIFIDTLSGTPRSEIFKMAYANVSTTYVYVGTSPDGFNWTAGLQPAYTLVDISDTQVVMLYTHENGGAYVLYGRKDEVDFENTTIGCLGGSRSGRRVIVTISNGSVYGPWSEPVETFPLGSPDEIQCLDSYNSGTLYYKGVYFLFPSAYRHWAKADSGSPYTPSNDGVMDIRLAVSRTPLGPYTFPSRDSFIPRGVGTIDPSCKILNGTGSDRDAGFVFSSANGLLDPDLLELNEDEKLQGSTDDNPSAWMYHTYWGSQTTHAGAITVLGTFWPGAYSGIFKARVRREGYVALSTLTSNPTGHGSLLTQVLSLPKSYINSIKNDVQLQLRINADVATVGFLNVQLEDGQTGNPIPGYTFDQCKTLHGTGIRQLIQWSRQNETTSNVTYTADLSPLVNYTNGIQIRMEMAHTKLYSWLLSYVED